jgi:hypothetical protein
MSLDLIKSNFIESQLFKLEFNETIVKVGGITRNYRIRLSNNYYILDINPTTMHLQYILETKNFGTETTTSISVHHRTNGINADDYVSIFNSILSNIEDIFEIPLAEIFHNKVSYITK